MKVRNIISFLMEAREKPFLKWAGAKTQLVGRLRRMFPEGDYRFIEPFVGSGVVFLNAPYAASLLADANPDIINLYAILKKKRAAFIERCHELFVPGNNCEEKYYELREEFNVTKDDLERRSSLFIYLNRHCYNGLCRYNQAGRFNTPFGRYERPHFPRVQMEKFAEKLQSAELRVADFRQILSKAGRGDVVYCDPPYVPLTKTASFTNYAKDGFSPADQQDLTDHARAAAERGALVIISNHDTPVTRELYRDATELKEVLVSRTISCDGKNRNKAKEVIAVFGDTRPLDLRLIA
jgi:DNA adenine methylase